jgi:hypothetical protein
MNIRVHVTYVSDFWYGWLLRQNGILQLPQPPELLGVMSAEENSLYDLIADLHREFTAKDVTGCGPIQEQQNRYSRALLKLSSFFGIYDETVATELVALARCFQEAQRGNKPLAFSTTKNPSRPKGGPAEDSDEVWLARAIAGYGLDLLLQSGMTEANAKKEVRKFKGLKRLLNARSRKLETSVMSWRDGIYEGTVKNRTAHKAYILAQETVDALNIVDPRQKHGAGLKLLALAEHEAGKILVSA